MHPRQKRRILLTVWIWGFRVEDVIRIISFIGAGGVITLAGLFYNSARKNGEKEKETEMKFIMNEKDKEEIKKDIDGWGAKLQRHIEKDEQKFESLKEEMRSIVTEVAVLSSETKSIKGTVSRIANKMGVLDE